MSMQNNDALRETLIKCRRSIEAHCKTFLFKRFTRQFSKGHYKLFEMIDDPSCQKICVTAHRGWGKTSIFNYAIPSQNILFKMTNFIVPCSASATSAVLQSENLKRTLIRSPLFRGAFQALYGYPDVKSENFSQEQWITRHGVMVLPRGTGQQVRGILFDDDRPGLIIPDDVETTESVNSDEQRIKLKKWFWSDCHNSIDRSKDDWRILFIGTILHEDSLLSNIREMPEWNVIEMPLCDEQYQSYWPQFMSDQKIKNLVNESRRAGMLEEFYREYMNTVIVKEDAVFKAANFRYYNETDVSLNDDRDVINVILVDPARTTKVHNADTAILGVAIKPSKNLIFVREVLTKKLTPEQIYQETLAMAGRLNAQVIGIEDTGLKEFIRQPMIDAMMASGKMYTIEWLDNRTGTDSVTGKNMRKSGRVGALASYYNLGRILHNQVGCEVLESQLLQYPYPKRWDAMDALSFVIEIMERGGTMFEPQYDNEMEELRLKELEREDARLEQMYNMDDEPLSYDDEGSFGFTAEGLGAAIENSLAFGMME